MLVVILIACILMILSNILFFCIILEQLQDIERIVKRSEDVKTLDSLVFKKQLETISKQIRSLQRK